MKRRDLPQSGLDDGPPGGAPIVTVSFEESECITRLGTKKTTYRIRTQDTWQVVGNLPTACPRSLPAVPGVVWMRIVEVRLAIGTKVEKTVESAERDRNATTGGVLFGRNRGLRRQSRRTIWSVAANGRLNPINDDASG